LAVINRTEKAELETAKTLASSRAFNPERYMTEAVLRL